MGETVRGVPIESSQLRDIGVSAALASHMTGHGWMTRLSRGVYMLTGDEPTREGVLVFLCQRVPGLHVGGASALRWAALRYDDAAHLDLWSPKTCEFPDWVPLHVPFSFQTTSVFDPDDAYSAGLTEHRARGGCIVVAEPERALCEMASDVGKSLSLEEATRIAAASPELRPATLLGLLKRITRTKVRRLVCEITRKADLACAPEIAAFLSDVDTGRRWSMLTRTGQRLTLSPQRTRNAFQQGLNPCKEMP